MFRTVVGHNNKTKLFLMWSVELTTIAELLLGLICNSIIFANLSPVIICEAILIFEEHQIVRSTGIISDFCRLDRSTQLCVQLSA